MNRNYLEQEYLEISSYVYIATQVYSIVTGVDREEAEYTGVYVSLMQGV